MRLRASLTEIEMVKLRKILAVAALLIASSAVSAGGVHGQVYGSVQWGGSTTYQRYGGVAVYPGAVIVYPQGVTTVYPEGTTGNPVYVQGAYADPRTCYVECFYVPRSQRYDGSNTNVRIWGSVEIRR